MTETIDSTSPAPDGAASAPKKRGGGLNSMLLADLKQMAGSMGISGSGGMKKAQLVEAIKGAQSGGSSGAKASAKASGKASSTPAKKAATDAGSGDAQSDAPAKQAKDAGKSDASNDDSTQTKSNDSTAERMDGKSGDNARQRDNQNRQNNNQGERNQGGQNQGGGNRNQGDRNQGGGNRNQGGNQGGQNQGDRNQGDRNQNQGGQPQGGGNQNRNDAADRGEDGNRNRRRRGRDRNRPGGGTGAGQRNEPDTTILEDDVLVPAAGILDVLDNYAFVRTSGYLPGTEDVYVSLSMVRKFGLRRGDAIVGQVRQPREGERKEKFNPMVRIDGVNGAEPEASLGRIEFAKLTPLYPSERLRLETEPGNLIGRVIDIAAPIGKGQRGLIVSPSKAGKTMIMQSIANSITTNNPECHLMVVLVDERPEEVTDFERSVKGEVISSTFDRPASDHTTVAELAIERAKRLVELGHDVVVLLDGITRLGRAYNLAAPPSGRILSGGVDSAALYPPKRFFGAARNIENGGSLTILATALIESGSKMDEVIFEEFKGTGNMEIRLRRDFADKRLFPAIDVVQSGTRREELLMAKDEMAIVWKLRRVLSNLDGQQALELLLDRLKKSQSNIEFLMQVQKTTPTSGQDD